MSSISVACHVFMALKFHGKKIGFPSDRPTGVHSGLPSGFSVEIAPRLVLICTVFDQ